MNRKNQMLMGLVVAAVSLVLLSLACALPVTGQGVQATSAAQNVPGASTPAAPAASAASATPAGPNPNPLPLRQGLASLDSYSLKIHVVNNGPTTGDRMEETMLFERDAKAGSDHTRTESISSTAAEPTPSTSTSESFLVGNQTCSISGSGADASATLKDLDPMAKDARNTLSSLIDYSLYVEKPVFVAEETVNGLATNHFTFTVSQFGTQSGAEVKKNSGEYWVAKDGQFLVKYNVALELSADQAGTKMMQTEITVELTQINQPLAIAFPAACQK